VTEMTDSGHAVNEAWPPGGEGMADGRAPNTPTEHAPDSARSAREQRILEAAGALLARWGYLKTTVEDVAREAGVGKGTIYLHWKDKTALFRAAIWHASKQVTEDMMRRVTTDPEGGQFYRLWTHGMVAVYANPLLAAVMSGRTDILRGLVDSLDAGTVSELFGNSEAQIERLQEVGLIRSDLPPRIVSFFITSLKIGIIDAASFAPAVRAPTPDELTEALSDLMRRWLEPERPPADSTIGKRIIGEWLEQTNAIFGQGEDPKE
jgi:AcrR family transcriptional regulator